MIFVIIAIIAVIVVIVLYKNRKSQFNNNTTEVKKINTIIFDDEIEEEENEMPYNKKLLLTKNEWDFYKKIKPICDEKNLHIIAKVRLADIVEPNSNLTYNEKQKYFNKISRKHIDFILCNPDNLAIKVLIELDDNSHNKNNRIESDNFKNELCEKVGYKLIRVKSHMEFEEKLNNIFLTQ